ncbi:MAG: MFS transporter, partial [Ancrocorticia sp.]
VTPWIIRRIGLDFTVVAGLSALAVVLIIRSFVPGVGLWIGTVGIGLAIGILNTTLPPIIKRDFPTRAATVTGVYSATLTLSSAIAAGIVVPITGATSWKIGLGIWAFMALIGLLAWGISMHARGTFSEAARTTAGSAPAPRGLRGAVDGPAAAQRPILTNPLAWAVTAFMGTQSLLFYMFVQWLPEIEQTHGVAPELAGVHMSFFQIAGLVATLALTALQRERADQRLAALTSCSLWIIGLAGFLFAPGLALVWAIIMGAGSGATFALSLTFINTRTRNSHESSRLSGMSQSVGYMIAAVGPTLGGALGDALGWNAVITLAIVLAALVMLIGMVAGSDRKI